MSRRQTSLRQLILATIMALVAIGNSQARSIRGPINSHDDVSNEEAVIPSPNQELGYESSEIRRQLVGSGEKLTPKANAPFYASPYVRNERALPVAAFEHQLPSSHAPLNYALKPAAIAPSHSASSDLKTSASYGHHHGGHHGYGPSGWLDMGAWTGGKGSFGWYADYPVGGKHGHYGRK